MKTVTASQAAAGVGAILGAFLGVIIVCALVYYVLLVIAWWKLFTKAGEKGWKSIIPFYNFYIQCKLTWAPKFFWITIVLCLANGVLQGIAGSMTGAGSTIMNVIAAAVGIAILVFAIMADYRLSKAYGHGGGYTVGLIFLNFIFMLILGFGKSKYMGNVYLDSKKK